METCPLSGHGLSAGTGLRINREVIVAGPESGVSVGETVFVPGANCFVEAAGLFGAHRQPPGCSGLASCPRFPGSRR